MEIYLLLKRSNDATFPKHQQMSQGDGNGHTVLCKLLADANAYINSVLPLLHHNLEYCIFGLSHDLHNFNIL